MQPESREANSTIERCNRISMILAPGVHRASRRRATTRLLALTCGRRLAPEELAAQRFEQDEEQRDKEDGDESSAEHAADDAGADGVATVGGCAGGDRQRYAAQYEGKRSHGDRSQP